MKRDILIFLFQILLKTMLQKFQGPTFAPEKLRVKFRRCRRRIESILTQLFQNICHLAGRLMFHRTVIAHTGASHISFTKTLLVTDLLGFVFCFALLTQSYVSIGRGTLYSQTKVGTLCQSFTTLPCVSKLLRTSQSNLWIIANDRNDCFEMATEK